ncbi:hypothetical protein N180_06225 [Pedobacter antarcticus 4BY]|uniref:N-acetyltransferase domain-containing protein n=1 Tax=Pedobacter antarcticus 4BY TaxID=1358423 RepID=A0A081PGK9_9SPHI|nr:hypothetical protein N180_06225 [Pedobacter antarcticus 4BY]
MVKSRPEHEDRIVSIWLEASKVAHHFIPASYWDEHVEEMRTIYLPSSQTYVYEDQQTLDILGFISMIDNYVAAVFVSPGFHRQGIGTVLLDFAKSRYRELDLGVYVKNKKAIAFYTKNGFLPVMQKLEENTGEMELVMLYRGEKETLVPFHI